LSYAKNPLIVIFWSISKSPILGKTPFFASENSHNLFYTTKNHSGHVNISSDAIAGRTAGTTGEPRVFV
jgi:hypothetical protein